MLHKEKYKFKGLFAFNFLFRCLFIRSEVEIGTVELHLVLQYKEKM